MQYVKCVLILYISLQLISDALTTSSGLPDFGNGDDDLSVHHFHADPDDRGFERMMLKDMAEDEPEFFNEKEKRVRDALIRSTQDVRSQRTLYEVLPILRSLSREQRLTLAALVATQTNLKSGKSMDLRQVEEMFGERRNLILPIISDIANIVKRNMVENVNEDEQRTSKSSENRSKRSLKYEDDRPSYHERKLNMTNFRGTPESNDQHAIESQTSVHVTLPNANASSVVSLEEIETSINQSIQIKISDNGSLSSIQICMRKKAR